MKYLSLLLVCFSLLFVSCTKKEEMKGKTLNLAVSSQVKGMDPIYANDRYSGNEVARVYEGLLQYHYLKRPYELTPNLAEAMPTVSDDGLTYTFKVKKGVFFQDDAAFPEGKGRELVAEDFVYSIKRLADPKLQGLGWWLLDGKIKGLNEWREKYTELPKTDYDEEVEGLKALDRYTVQFKLSKQFPQFLYSLAMPFTFAVAREVVEKYGDEFLNHPIGTGPFAIKNGVFKQTKKIHYYKNPTFREKLYPCEASEEFKNQGFLKDCGKKLPLVDRIVVNIIEENQPRWLNFEKGKVDYVAVPKDNFDTVIPDAKNLGDDYREKKIELLITPSLDVTYIAFNHDFAIFKNNKKLRQAMSLAYDIQEVNKKFNNNQAIPAQSIIPPGIAGYMENYTNPFRGHGKKEEIEKAKKLLAEAGFPEGKGLPAITYDCPNTTVSRQQGEFFKLQMAKIGINVKVIQNPWPELQKKITTRNVMTYGIAWSADYPDAENFLQLLYGPNKAPGANGSGFDHPEFNKLYKVASVMQDGPERTALYEKMNRLAAEEVPWIFGVHRQSFVVKHGWLKNYISTDFEAGIVQYLNIDKKEKSETMKKL